MLIAKPSDGDKLFLYLEVADEVVSSVLVKEEDGVHRPVYFISKVLRGAELRYSHIEKAVYALVDASRKMARYFQSNLIIVLTDLPIRRILRKPTTSGRMVVWSVELEQHGILYSPRIAIKAQALTDFIAECTFAEREPSEGVELKPINEEDEEELETWTVFANGASNSRSAGAGVILKTPEGLTLRYAVRILKPATNNVAEYEALLAGLRVSESMKLKRVLLKGDSKLVMEQVRGDYQARDPVMQRYLLKVNKQLEAMKGKGMKVVMEHIPREDNEEADEVAKLAADNGAEFPRDIILEETAHLLIEEALVSAIEENTEDWRTPVIKYLKDAELPEEEKEKKIVVKRASRCELVNGELIRRNFSHPATRCVSDEEGSYILREIHAGICGMHVCRNTMVAQVLRSGFY